MYVAKQKKPVQNATYCIIPFIWHSEKVTTTETKNKLVVSKIFLRGEDGWKKWNTQGFLGWWNYPVWNYNGRYDTLYFFQIP